MYRQQSRHITFVFWIVCLYAVYFNIGFERQEKIHIK